MTFTLQLLSPWNRCLRAQTKFLSSGIKNCCHNCRENIFPGKPLGTTIASMNPPNRYWNSEDHSWVNGVVGLHSPKAGFMVTSTTRAKSLCDGMSKSFAISARHSCVIQPHSQGT